MMSAATWILLTQTLGHYLSPRRRSSPSHGQLGAEDPLSSGLHGTAEARRVSHRTRWAPRLTLLASVTLIACDGVPQSQEPEELTRPVFATAIVSDPVPEPGAAAAATSLSGAVASEFAYVSLPPGTVPSAEQATIRNPHSGSTVTVTMRDGGFDPVAVAANAGDTLDLDIHVAGATEPLLYACVVPGRRPPVVVRTDPPPKKRDVPLNATMLIVFSEPVDPATITPRTVQLRLNGQAVGATRVLSADRLWLELHEALVPQAEYSLVVTSEVIDLDAESLESSIEVPFTTATDSAPAPPGLSLVPGDTLWTVPGWGTWLRATVTDATGSEALGVATRWYSSNPSVAHFNNSPGTWDGWGHAENLLSNNGVAGAVTVTARGGGYNGSATVILDWATFGTVSVGANGLMCFLTLAGAAYCRGGNQFGQLGAGIGQQAEDPVSVAGRHVFKTLSAGFAHVCALDENGAAYCWGNNSWGASAIGTLGDGTDALQRDTPVPVAGGLAFVRVSAGFAHTCALRGDGVPYCWGKNDLGQLGSSAAPFSTRPVPVEGGLAFVDISAGGQHSCGLTAAGAAYCWGINAVGQLGDGSRTATFVPALVTGGHTFIAIDAGMQSTCGATSDGEVLCWGAVWSEGDTASVPTLITLPPGIKAVAVSSGMFQHCALTADGAAYCWGWTYLEEPPYEVALPPARVGELALRSISAEGDACGVTAEPVVYCWSVTRGLLNRQPWRLEGQR